jgi:hypothetical protein
VLIFPLQATAFSPACADPELARIRDADAAIARKVPVHLRLTVTLSDSCGESSELRMGLLMYGSSFLAVSVHAKFSSEFALEDVTPTVLAK